MGQGPAVPALSLVSAFWGREAAAPHQGYDEEGAFPQKRGVHFPGGINATEWGGD